MNAVNRVKWRLVCILAAPVVQTLLAALPPKYFFSPPLPFLPFLFPLSFFLFLRIHCTTCQSSLVPSHILSALSSLHLTPPTSFLDITTNVRIFAFEIHPYLRPSDPDLGFIFSAPSGNLWCLSSDGPFSKKNYVYMCLCMPTFCVLITDPFSPISLLRMLTFSWLITQLVKKNPPSSSLFCSYRQPSN